MAAIVYVFWFLWYGLVHVHVQPSTCIYSIMYMSMSHLCRTIYIMLHTCVHVNHCQFPTLPVFFLKTWLTMCTCTFVNVGYFLISALVHALYSTSELWHACGSYFVKEYSGMLIPRVFVWGGFCCLFVRAICLTDLCLLVSSLIVISCVYVHVCAPYTCK